MDRQTDMQKYIIWIFPFILTVFGLISKVPTDVSKMSHEKI